MDEIWQNAGKPLCFRFCYNAIAIFAAPPQLLYLCRVNIALIMNKRIGILCLLWAVMMPAFAQQISRESQERLMMQQRKLAFLLNVVENLYVDTVDIQSVTDDAIVSILEELDPHSAYIPKEEVQRANEALEGSFSGIGVQFQMLEDTLFVIQTISGCPRG